MFPRANDSIVYDAPHGSTDLLAELASNRVEEVRVGNDKLLLIASYLAAHPPKGPDDIAIDDDPCLLGDRPLPLAGEGAPAVSEFAVIALGPVLGTSIGSVRRLAGDVLELAHRLPRVWSRVREYSVAGWRARQVADSTRHLSPEAVAWVDAQIAPILHKRGRVTIDRLVKQALATFDPEAAALSAEEKAEQFDVKIDLNAATLFDEDPGGLGNGAATGHAYLDATMDLADAADLETAIAAIAEDMTHDDRYIGWSRGRRRAAALGELARRYTSSDPPSDDGTARVLHLYCHVDQGDLRGTGLVKVGNYGAVVPIERVHEWAMTPGTVVRPVKVIDLSVEMSRNGYVPSQTQHEQAVLRAGDTCAFPGCTCSARLTDTEHAQAYDTGGRTSSRNLAKVCRTHHRLKTFGGWTYTQPVPGTYLWLAPTGEQYVRLPDGTSFELNTRLAAA